MTREDAIAEIEAAGARAVHSSWLKATLDGTSVTTTGRPYWEAQTGEIKAHVERWVVREQSRLAVFASGDRERIRQWMADVSRETHSLDLFRQFTYLNWT